MKRVVMIGDSIRVGYQAAVAEALAGVAEASGPPDNGGDSANVLEHLTQWAISDPPDVVHVNAGLHDIKRAFDSMQRRVPLDQYRRNVEAILARLINGTSAKVVWANTTPVNQKWHHEVKGFDRFEVDVRDYNRAAVEVAFRLGVPIDDLYGAVMAAGRDGLLTADGVHFTEEGYRFHGKAVADRILTLFPSL